MPIIDTNNKSLQILRGIHVWHADMSSCSQRVRIALVEKNLPFISHLIDLHAGENASEFYQSIHPNGLVPAMVIDGVLFIESIDIIDEINLQSREASLRPKGLDESEINLLMKRAEDAQPALKLLTFEFLFSATMSPLQENLEAFQHTHKNEKLKKFHRDFAKGFTRDRVSRAVRQSHEGFMALEMSLLAGRSFLAGDYFSLADIAWMPNVHRFALFKWPFINYPNLNAWFGRVSKRPSYKKGLADWEPKEFINHVTPKIILREKAGDGVGVYLRRYT